MTVDTETEQRPKPPPEIGFGKSYAIRGTATGRDGAPMRGIRLDTT